MCVCGGGGGGGGGVIIDHKFGTHPHDILNHDLGSWPQTNDEKRQTVISNTAGMCTDCGMNLKFGSQLYMI